MAAERLATRKRPTFRGIQALRGAAACMVVIFHTTLFFSERSGVTTATWVNGSAGVDVFFVISGFVMAVSTIGREHKVHPARSFLERRFIRLVPLYWLMTMLMWLRLELLRRAARAGGGGPQMVDTPLGYVLSSLLFVPYRNSIGITQPLLAAGWTLSFEMLFYLLFALALALRVRVVYLLTPVMIALSVVGIFRQNSWPAITVLADPLLLEFLAGLLLGEAVTRGFSSHRGFSWTTVLSSGLAIVALPILLLWPAKDPPDFRILQFGVPAYLLVQAVVLLEDQFGGMWPRWMLLIGDASYSLYLSHIFILPFTLKILDTLKINPPGVPRPIQEVIPCLLCLLATVMVAIPLYLLVEEPTTNLLRRRWLSEGKPQSNAIT